MSSALKLSKDGTVKRRWYGYAFDKNPAAAEHIINGYLGGMSTFFSNIIKTGHAAVSEDVDWELYTTPIFGRFTRQAFYKEGYDTWFETADMVKDIEAMERALQKEKDWESYTRFKQNRQNTELVQLFHIYDDRVKQLQELTKNNNLSLQERSKYSQQLDSLIAEAAKIFEDILSRYEKN